MTNEILFEFDIQIQKPNNQSIAFLSLSYCNLNTLFDSKNVDIDMLFQEVRSTDKTNVSCPGDSSSTLGKGKTRFMFD